MAKEFVRKIKNTTVNEPLNTNEQNDLINDTQHIYIRNKNSYYPLTKGLFDIVPKSGSIIQTEKIIDGTENNRVVIKNNLENLKSVINSIIDTPDFTLTPEMINEFLSVTDGLVKSIKDGKIELKPQTPISEITGDIDQQTEKINTLQGEINKLKSDSKIKYITLNANYDSVYQEIENATDEFIILNIDGNFYYRSGYRENKHYFFNALKTGNTGFLDYQIVELGRTNASLYKFAITPSEVINLWQWL